VKFGRQINLSILILLGGLALVLVTAGYFAISRIIVQDNQSVFDRELHNIDSNIRQSYNELQDAGLLGLDDYVGAEKNRLLQMLDGYSFSETGHLHIFESNGRVVKGDADGTDVSYEVALFQQMQNTPSKRLTYEENGLEFFAVGKASSHWDWLLVVTISKQELFAARDFYLKLALGLSFLAFILAAIFSAFVSRKLQRRIDQTLDCLQAVERGDLTSRIANSSGDEIGTIQAGINSMIETVSTKTSELEASNQSLHKEIAQRRNAEQALQMAKNATEAVNRELRMSENRLQLVIDTVPVVLVLKDRQGRHLLVNYGFEQATGVSREDALGKTVADLFPTKIGREIFDFDEELMASGRDDQRHEEMSLPDGSIRTFYSRKVPFRDEQGKVIGLVMASLDVTEQKLAEQELLIAKDAAESANQSKSVFLGNMSHELRTPLNAILGFSEMLAQDVNASPQQQEKFNIINRSGFYLLGLINDVLDLSRIEAGRVELEAEKIDLPDMLKTVARMFEVRALSTGLKFNLELDPDIAQTVKTDVGKLRQIIVNLLDNAVKFTSEGSFTLRARTLPIYDDPDVVTLRVMVEDTGIGIEEAQQQRIFQPFLQASRASAIAKGTGLGLTISKSFVELMGGNISVQSTPGKGSKFTFEVPVALSKGRIETYDGVTAIPAVVGQEAGQPVWRVLVVEDYFDSRLLLNSLLAQTGFETREAENGEEAIKQFEQWQPHFIWMDMRMPVMDGYEATRIIRQLPGGDKVKIVALTASAFKDQRANILGAGCDDVMHKPFQAREVFDAMARQLGVRYIYDEAIETWTDDSALQNTEAVQAIPEGLRAELQAAAESLSSAEFETALAKIEMQDSTLVRKLAALAREFRFDLILKLLDAGEAGETEQT